MALTTRNEAEERALLRMRMTPPERRADALARRQAAMDRLPEARRAEMERLAAMPDLNRCAICLLLAKRRVERELTRPEIVPVLPTVADDPILTGGA